MVLIVALVMITALVILGGTMLRRPEADRGWRDQAEGLRERMEHEEIPRA